MVQRQVRLQENYDWIVLGDSPAALLSAALVARMGLSVLIVAEDGGKKWEVSDSGQLMDLEPNFMLGMARLERLGGVVAECLSRLRIAPSEWQRFERPEAIFQTITPSVRALYPLNNEALEREFRREASGAALEPWLRLLDALSATELMSHGFWRYLPERLTLRDPQHQALPMEVPLTEELLCKRVQSLVEKSPPGVKGWFGLEGVGSSVLPLESQQEWLQGWLAGMLGKEWPTVSAYHSLQLLSLARTGVRVTGGISAFRQSLLRLAIRLGAQWIAPEGETRRLFIEGGRILGLQLGTKGSVLRTRGIAAARSMAVLQGWAEGDVSAPLAAHEGLRITLGLSVHDHGIPEGMAERAVWKEAGSPAIEIERTKPEHYGLPGSDYQVVFLRSVFPNEAMAWDAEQWRAVLARMYRQAAEVMPFLDENCFRRFPDFRSPEFADQWVRFYGAGQKSTRRELTGVVTRELGKSEHWKVEGLFLLDGSHRPQWGSLGEFADALEATAWMAHRSGLAGPLG